MGIGKYKLVVLWYLLPFLYLCIVEGVFLFNTAMILLVFFIALSIGYFSFSRVQVQKPVQGYRLLNQFFKIVFWITIIVQAYGFYRVVVDGIDIARYRMDYFEAAGGVFKSTYLFTLYSVFLKPLLLIAVMFWLNGDLTKRKTKRLVLFGFLIIALDGILSLGRFPYLYVLFFFYLSYKAFGFKRIFLIVSFSTVAAISFLTIYLRQFFVDAAVDSAIDIVNTDVVRNSIVSYQYNGFVLLDHLVEGKSVLGHPWEMNTGSFLFLFTKTITTKFGFDFSYSWEHYNLLLTEGIYHERLSLLINAFATNFLPVYLDLGYPGIFIYGFFSGIFLGFRTGNLILKTLQYLNLFILIFGLYQPIITTLPGFVLLLAFTMAIFYFVRSCRQYLLKQKYSKTLA
jgi:hypothetical protein